MGKQNYNSICWKMWPNNGIIGQKWPCSHFTQTLNCYNLVFFIHIWQLKKLYEFIDVNETKWMTLKLKLYLFHLDSFILSLFCYLIPVWPYWVFRSQTTSILFLYTLAIVPNSYLKFDIPQKSLPYSPLKEDTNSMKASESYYDTFSRWICEKTPPAV